MNLFIVKGMTIKVHTQLPNSVVNEIGIITGNVLSSSHNDKFSMIQAANNLLNAITRVLLLADIVLINQILNSKNKVTHSNNHSNRCFNDLLIYLISKIKGLIKLNEAREC